MRKKKQEYDMVYKKDSFLGIRLGLGVFLGLLIFWIMFVAMDFCFVAFLDTDPLFCTKHGNHYTGLGYSFDKYPHPVNSDNQYSFYVFGQDLSSKFHF